MAFGLDIPHPCSTFPLPSLHPSEREEKGAFAVTAGQVPHGTVIPSSQQSPEADSTILRDSIHRHRGDRDGSQPAGSLHTGPGPCCLCSKQLSFLSISHPPGPFPASSFPRLSFPNPKHHLLQSRATSSLRLFSGFSVSPLGAEGTWGGADSPCGTGPGPAAAGSPAQTAQC